MRLYLDENQGAGSIPCPDCGRPLLLAAERRGRWVVGYQHLHLRVGRQGMLVCPDVSCTHREDVEIVGQPDEAVVYSSSRAAYLWSSMDRTYNRTLGEIHARLRQLATLYEQTGNPKIPSAWKYWRERYRFTYWMIIHALRRSQEDDEEVVLGGKELDEKGRVVEILEHAVELEKSDGSGTLIVPLAELDHVYTHRNFFSEPGRFEFGDGSDLHKGNHTIHTPTYFAIVCGHRVGLDSVSTHGLCRIRTDDPKVAEALGLRPFFGYIYGGETPAGFVERCFRAIRFCYVNGHRLHLRAVTKDPNVVQLGTRNMETARALKMHQDRWMWLGMRKQLRWHRFFYLSEIERFEEKQIPFQIWDMVRAEQIRTGRR